MIWLTAEQVWLIHVMIVIRDLLESQPQASIEAARARVDLASRQMRIPLLESAVHVPLQPYYRNPWQRLAALFRSLVKNHAFFDGNKRTALIALELTMQMNGYEIRATQRQRLRFTLEVARGKSLWAIESWLRRCTRPIRPTEVHGLWPGVQQALDLIGIRNPFQRGDRL